MSKEEIVARMDSLRKGEAQLNNDLHATRGAIIDCEFWLKKLEEEPCKSSETEPPPEET